MLDRSKMIGGFKNGEYNAATGITYYGGSPAAMDTDGYLTLCTSDVTTGATAYVGVFANSNLVDWQKSSTGTVQRATVYFGSFSTVLYEGTRDTYADGLPYTSGDSWVEADPLYVGADGKWTNTDPGSGKQRGVVMIVGSASLTVWLYA